MSAAEMESGISRFFSNNESARRVDMIYLTLRRLMSYIYGAPILDVSRSHNDAAQSVGLLWTSDQLVAETST